MSTFIAKYPGTCPACETRIKAGQELTYDGENDKPIHVECPLDDLTVTTGTCPHCFMVLPVSGICGSC